MHSRRLLLLPACAAAATLAVVAVPGPAGGAAPAPLRFAVSFDSSVRAAPVNGRVLVVLSRDGSTEPRYQIDIVGGVPFWGQDVHALRPGQSAVLGTGRPGYGYPLQSVRQIPPGNYYVQAFLNTYSTFSRSDGSTVQLHMPCGDGQYMFNSPGNLYGVPRRIHLDPASSGTVHLALDRRIAVAQPVPPGGTCQQGNPPDSAHVRHFKIRSAALSRFWGRPMYVGATVLLPAGYDDPRNRRTRYPVEMHFDHFTTAAPHGFEESGGNAFSSFWLSGNAPRFISVEVREENPYYDSSYVVNSRNLGPYGTATNRELLPAIDRTFRTIGTRWSRVTSGGSTGGWEALASQVFYPDVYGGTFAGYPDPVDFHKHQIVDIYRDANAYETIREWDRTPRPDSRQPDGNLDYTMAQENHWELALGDRDRSEGAWAIWEAVYGPQGADGYPALVWDKRTGAIDHAVARQWKPFDLTAVLTSQWRTLGPKVAGRIYVYVGDTDTYYLNDAVELLQAALARERSPRARATFVYGHEQPHGWSPYTDQQWFAVYAAYIASHAPRGTVTAAWRGNTAPPAMSGPGVVVRASGRR